MREIQQVPQTIQNNANLAFRHKLVRAKLAASVVLDMLKEFEQEQAQKPRDWGYAGTAGKVYQNLLETMGSLRGCEPEDAAEVVEDLIADANATYTYDADGEPHMLPPTC